MMVTGGAVTVAGIVMTVLNRPQRILPKVDVTPTNGGMIASTSWVFCPASLDFHGPEFG